MKKCLVPFLLCIICGLVGCKGDSAVITSGIYKMEIEQEKNQQMIVFVPTLSVDTKQKEFMFCYDALSSYLPVGSYEISNNILTATTSDSSYHYVFEIVDKNTLSFLTESSSEITVFDKSLGIVPQDGAIFKKADK